MTARKTFAASQSAIPAVDPAPAESLRWRCVAYGCPMLAGIHYRREGDFEKMICRFHDQQGADRWQGISAALNRVRAVVDLMCRVQSWEWAHATPDWPAYADRVCVDAWLHLAPRVVNMHNGAARDEREFPSLYASRLNAWLRSEACSTSPIAEVRASHALEHIKTLRAVLASAHVVNEASEREARAERAAIQAEGGR